MATDREDKRAESFTNFEKGVRADEFIFGDRGYTEADMKILDEGVAYLLTGTDPPDPPTDPGAPPDALWNASVGNNKLEANLAISNYTTEITRAWIVVVDSDTVPTNDAVIGVSPPTGFTPGDWPTTNFLSSYASSEDWYFYEYDDVEGVVLVKTTTGTDFITIVPKDTLGAVWLSGTAGFDIDDNGAYTIVPPTDAGVGLAAAETYDIYVDDNIVLSKTTALTGSVSVAAGVHIAYAVARDESGNIGQSDEVSFTIATLTGGTVSLPLVTQEVSEDGTSIAVTLTRTGGTADFDIDVSTRDITALAGAGAGYNYTALVSETVEFRSASNSETVTVVVRDDNLTTNKVLNLEIDYDNADVADGTVEVGTESCLVKINAASATGLAGFQMREATPFYVSFQAESFTDIRSSIESGQTSDQWAITGEDNKYAPVNGLNRALEAVSANTYGSKSPVVFDPNAPYAEYAIHFTSAAISANSATNLFDIYTRTLTHSTHPSDVFYTLVNPIVSIVWSAPDGGTATITMDYNAGASMAGNTVWLEDVTGDGAATYNAVAGLTVATHTLNTNVFTVTGVGADLTPDADTGNVLGSDPDAIVFTPDFDTDGAMKWIDDKNAPPLPLYVDEAATRLFRIYMFKSHGLIDVVTIAARVNAWTENSVDVTDNGGGYNPSDENMGHIQSNYSAGSPTTPPDDPENPAFPYVPLPDATVASLACS